MQVEFLHTRLPLRARFVVALFCYTLAALLQVMLVKGGSIPLTVFRFAGMGLLVIPLWFLKARNFSNKVPAGRATKQEGTWTTVTMTELDRLTDRIAATRKLKIPAFYNYSLGLILTFLSIFLLVPIGAIIGAAGLFAIVDLYLVFFPFLWFARIEKWSPAISGKIDIFRPVLEAELPKTMVLAPMFLFDGDGRDQMPSDIRLMLAPGTLAAQEVRDELLGAQFQITYNKGPNGAVPYMYAVFITRGKGRIWQFLKNIRLIHYVTEPGSSTEGDVVYGTVVLRLDTKSRSDGYHTHESDVRELVDMAVRTLEKL